MLFKWILAINLLLLTACSSLGVGMYSEGKKISCSEKAAAKSLQYLEQKYRCTTEIKKD